MLRPFRIVKKMSDRNLTSRAALTHNAAFIEFSTTCCGKVGFCAGNMTDVHGTSRAIGI